MAFSHVLPVLSWPIIGLVVGLTAPVVAQPPVPAPSASAPPASQTMAQQADQLFQQGVAQFNARQVAAALELWEQALALYQQSGDRTGEGRVLGNLGAVYEALGESHQAIAYFEQSLAVARAIPDPQGISFALGNLGYVYENIGDYPQAMRYQTEALDLARAQGDREGERYTLNNLGIIYKAQGLYEQAIQAFQDSLAIARERGNMAGIANALGNLGNAQADQGDYAGAIAAYQEVLPLMQSVGDRVGHGAVLLQLGILYTRLGNPTQGAEYHQQSLAIAREVGDLRLEANNLGNLAIIAYNAGHPEQALQQLDYTLRVVRQTGERPHEASVLHTLGNIAASLGHYPDALTYYQQSLAIAREIGNPTNETVALGGLAQTYDTLGQEAQAADLYRQSLAIAQATGNRQHQGLLHSNLGMMLFEAGQLEPAATELMAAVLIWESLRPGLSDADQISLFETQTETYRALQRVLIQLGREKEALEWSERGRARAFIELVARRLSVQAATQLQTPPPTLADIQRIAAEQNATLVQYAILSPTQVGIWVIQPDGTIAFRPSQLEEQDISISDIAEESRVAAVLGRGTPPSEAAIAHLVSLTRRAVITADPLETGRATHDGPSISNPDPSPRRLNRRLHRLHQVLIDPIADLLPTDPTAHVVFVPQGSLFLVPFAALQGEDGRYLIERYTLLTAPAIQVLDLTHGQRQRQSSPGPSLIVGNPVMPVIGSPPEPLAALPYAEAEAEAIAQILHSEAITGGAATEQAIAQRMPDARIIHLATHGLLDEVEGLGIPGAIALTPNPTTDGFLTANEILSLPLTAELVVLSACDTGRGRITGDGVIGLSRSFLSAGATSVVVSLWAVPDDATALLMTEFYRALQETDDKAQALRQAMLLTMQQYPSSRDWAAFTLVGEGR